MVVAGHQHVAVERHVGVGKAQRRATIVVVIIIVFVVGPASSGRRVGFALGLFDQLLQRQPGRVLRVEEAIGLGQCRQQLQVHRNLPGIVQPGGKAHTRVGRIAGQHGVHALDFGFD